jgi:hypothetical protein
MTTFDSTAQRVSREALVGEHRRGSRVRTTPAGTWFPAVDPHGNPAGLLLVHPGVDVKVLVPTLARLVELQLPGVLPPRAQLNNQAGRNWLITEASPVPVLSEVLDDDGPHRLPANAAVLLSDVAATLATLHQAGVVHGRLAANAVVIGQGGSALLTDFGTKPDAGPSDDVAAWTQLARLLAEKWCDDAPEAAAALARAVGAAAGNGLAAGYDQLRQLAAEGRRDLLAQLAARRLAEGAKPKPIRKRVPPPLPPELAELEDDEPPARRSPTLTSPEPAPAAPPTAPSDTPEPPPSVEPAPAEPETGRQPMRPDQLIRSQQMPAAPPRQSDPRWSTPPAAPAQPDPPVEPRQPAQAQPAAPAQPATPAESRQPAQAQAPAPPRSPARSDQPQPPTRPDHTGWHQAVQPEQTSGHEAVQPDETGGHQAVQPEQSGWRQAVRPEQTGGFPKPVQPEQRTAPPAHPEQTGPHQRLAPPTRPEYTGPQPPVRPDQPGPQPQQAGPPRRLSAPLSDTGTGRPVQPQRPFPGQPPRRIGLRPPAPTQPPAQQPPAQQQPAASARPPSAPAPPAQAPQADAPPARQQQGAHGLTQPIEQADPAGLGAFHSAPRQRTETARADTREPEHRPAPDRSQQRRTDQPRYEPSAVEQTERMVEQTKPDAGRVSLLRTVLIGVLVIALAIASALLYLRVERANVERANNGVDLAVNTLSTQSEYRGTLCMMYASLTTNGKAGTLMYRWTGDQATPDPVESLAVAEGQTQLVIGKQFLPGPSTDPDPIVSIQLFSPTPMSAPTQPINFCK